MTSRGEVKDIAIRGLRRCYGPYGIYAGRHQFRDYWARDALWTCVGALRLQDMFHIKRTLRLFLHFEKDGHIPLRIGNKHFIQTYLGFRSKKLHPRYEEDKSGNYSAESAALLILALSLYLEKTGDQQFINQYMPKARKIISRLTAQTGKDRLLEERQYTTWMDSISKEGYIFYTNLLIYLALEHFQKICKKMHLHPHIAEQENLDLLKKNINKKFWNKEYFTDWIGNNDKDYFDTFANLIAIYFDFANKTQKKKIFNHIKNNNIARKDGSILKSFPAYDEKYISKKMIALGLKTYCSKVTYPWMSLFYYACKFKEEKKEDESWDNLCRKIIEANEIYECYDMEGKPYSTFLYKAEHPFAWGCGFALLTIRKG